MFKWRDFWAVFRSITDINGQRTYEAFKARPRCGYPGCGQRFKSHTELFRHQFGEHH